MDTVAAAKEAQKLIDKEILYQEASISKELLNTRRKTYTRSNPETHSSILQLKYRRNTYAPILRLPEEILLKIAAILRDEFPLFPEHWHQVAHVCRGWRRVVVGAPTLWTSPPPSLQDYALLMLERSKLSPLHVCAMKPDILPALLKHMRRIQVLELILDPESLEIAQKIILNLHQEASLLKRLSIFNYDGHHLSEDGPGPPKFRFSLPTFRPTDSLRQLSLHNVKFDWRVLPLPGLTHLSLTDISVVAAVSGDQFVGALGRMVGLEILVLSFGNIQLYDYPPETPLTQINLPRLTSLDIQPRSLRSQSQCFLSQASLPQLRELEIDWELGTDHEWRSGMLRQVSLSIEKGNFGILDELEILQDCFRVRPRSTPWRLSQVEEVEESPRADVFLPFERYNSHHSGAMIEEIISTIVSRVSDSDLSSLARVCITGNIRLTAIQFIHLFGSLPSLEIIGVSSDYIRLLTKALTIAPDHPLEVSLQFSAIRSVEWHYVGTDDLEVYGEMDYEELEEFCDCLMQRYEYGVPIDCLKMLDCSMKYEQVNLLKEILVNVVTM